MRSAKHTFFADDERVTAAFKMANDAWDRWRRAHHLVDDEHGHVAYAWLGEDGNVVDEIACTAASSGNPHRIPSRLIKQRKALVALAVAQAAAVDVSVLWPPVDDDETVPSLVDRLVGDLITAPVAPPRLSVASVAA